MNKAIFLDRDGVLIEDVSYPHKIEDLKIEKDIVPYLKWAKDNNFLLIIVTNQAGIAKGKFTLEDYKNFHNFLITELQQLGVEIDDTFFCPYHKDGVVEPYNIDSNDRKPNPGMINKAAEKYNIDISKSFMIGDKYSDNINLNELKCYILSSQYTKGKEGTYNTIHNIFKEIKGEV